MILVADPFSALSFGSRPSFAAYWPDTRFIELYPHSEYFHKMLGHEPQVDCVELIGAAVSVVQHERVHWQVAHSLSWGMMRSSLISLKTTLASLFLRQQSPEELKRCLQRLQSGTPPIARHADLDLNIRSSWTANLHSTAEHAWICAILPYLLDKNSVGLSSLRPPEYMLGVASQYLANGFNARAVLECNDLEFQKRVKTFKRTADYATFFSSELTRLPSPQSIEECLAVVSQLNHLRGSKHTNPSSSELVRRFESDLRKSIFGGSSEIYAHCFREAAHVFKTEVSDLNTTLLGIICELALDPPLPFLAGGVSSDWTWRSFHPSYRFQALLNSSAMASIKISSDASENDSKSISEVITTLLSSSGLERCLSKAVSDWLSTFDEDTTQWPSEELAYEHAQFSLSGRKELHSAPGVLIDSDRRSNPSSTTNPFYDLPYVLIDGHTQSIDPDSNSVLMEFGQHTLNAYLARATDFYVFGKKRLETDGLPRHENDGFTVFSKRLHEYFTSAFHLEVPMIRI